MHIEEIKTQALIQISQSDSPEAVANLLDKGLDPDTQIQHNTLLGIATTWQRSKTIQLLVGRGASINGWDALGTHTPLFLCDNPHIARLLIALGGDVSARNKFRETPLHFATNPAVASVLLEAGADVDALDDQGNTPLFHISTKETAIVLVEAGANIAIRNIHGVAPDLASDIEVIEAYEARMARMARQALCEGMGIDGERQSVRGRSRLM